jgi:HEPN domain-containing protein
MERHERPEESRRTTALALWRYAHDYLKAAQTLFENDHVTCNESQALYHLASQAVEFALKSYLRACGVSPEDLSARIGHSMQEALQEALARGLPTPPAEVVHTIQEFTPYLRDDQFRYLPAGYGEFPDLEPLLAAGIWILSQVADNAVADYFVYHGHGSGTDRNAMLRRLRADLIVTASKIPLLQ